MSRKRNTFSKALKHLKTDGIVEAAPVNSTMGMYSIVPGTLTRTQTVPGPTIPDESTIDWDIDGGSGGDTSGLFDSEGNSKLIAPPGDNSYILGPMAAMFYNYASTDWTMIGYIRETDRRMINLGYLLQNKAAGSEFDGKLSDWDGVNDFNSYGQLTLEQALWFRDTKKKDDAGNDPDNYNYRAFYPGPPSSTPDAFGRYLCCITGTPKATKDTTVTKTTAPIELQGSDNLSAIIDKVSKGQKLSKAEKALLKKSRGVDWDKVGKVVNTALTIADAGLMVASLIGILIPEPTTSAAGAAGLLSLLNKFRLANKLRKGQGLARGLRNLRVGATGLKSQGFRAIKGGALHKGSKGLLSPGGRGVYSAPTVGRVGRSSLRPGTGAARYTKYKSNPFAKGGPDKGGGVVGSIVPGGARRIGGIEPQAVVNPRTFQKGNKLFNKVMGGQYKNSSTANRIRSMAKKVGFNPGQANISLKNLLRMNYEYAYNYYLIESSEDQQDLMIIQLMDNPKFVKRLPEIISGFEDEADLIQILDMMGGIDDGPGELHPDNPLSTEDDPWALKKQQTQEGVNLSEDKKTRIMKSLKEPVVLPETKQKSYKVSPGKRNKTNFQGMDKLVTDVRSQKPFKRTQDIWSKEWQGYNSKLSQEKKNEVLEMIGDGKLAFNYMLTDSKKMNADQLDEFWGLNPDFYSYFFGGKKYKATRKEQVKGDYIVFLIDEDGNKSSMLQSELNIKLEEENQKEMLNEYNKILSEQEPNPFFKDPLMKKVAKRLKNEIEYEDKPAVKGYPNEPPPEMVKGFHPKYGKTYKYDKLDPVSAVVMRNAPTGDPEIDANVDKAAKKIKKLKPKVKEDYFDWRQSLQESDWTNVTSGNKVGQTFRHVSGATIRTGGALGGVETIPTSVTVDGETLSAPPISDYGLQGHASPIDGWEIARKNNKKKAKQINDQLDASEEVARRANADALMQARVDEFQEKVDKINAYNDTVRIHNWEKVTDYVKSLKLKGITARDLQKKGVIKIKGGAVGMKDDGNGNIKIRVFKGPDVYVKGKGIYYLGQDYTTEGEDFNTEEGVAPVPVMPDDLQKWQDAQYAKNSIMAKNLTLPKEVVSDIKKDLDKGINFRPSISQKIKNIASVQLGNILKLTTAVASEATHGLVDFQSPANMMLAYNEFAVRGAKGEGSSPDNPVNANKLISNNDKLFLERDMVKYVSQLQPKAIQNFIDGKDHNEILYSYIKDSFGESYMKNLALRTTFGGTGGVRPVVTIENGMIVARKQYGFRALGSAEELSDGAKKITALLNIPGDITGAGGFSNLVAPIAGTIGIHGDDIHARYYNSLTSSERGKPTSSKHSIYNVPDMHYEYKIPLSSILQPILDSVKQQKSTNKVKSMSKRQSLSLDEPIVRDKKKKKVNESKALSKIKNQFSYKGQPSADGFPDSPPPEMKDGWHPRYGKNANRYKKLDPDSANAMPKTGDAETDAIVAKQKSKS